MPIRIIPSFYSTVHPERLTQLDDVRQVGRRRGADGEEEEEEVGKDDHDGGSVTYSRMSAAHLSGRGLVAIGPSFPLTPDQRHLFTAEHPWPCSQPSPWPFCHFSCHEKILARRGGPIASFDHIARAGKNCPGKQ